MARSFIAPTHLVLCCNHSVCCSNNSDCLCRTINRLDVHVYQRRYVRSANRPLGFQPNDYSFEIDDWDTGSEDGRLENPQTRRVLCIDDYASTGEVLKPFIHTK